jgi:hypothetical protein
MEVFNVAISLPVAQQLLFYQREPPYRLKACLYYHNSEYHTDGKAYNGYDLLQGLCASWRLIIAAGEIVASNIAPFL